MVDITLQNRTSFNDFDSQQFFTPHCNRQQNSVQEIRLPQARPCPAVLAAIEQSFQRIRIFSLQMQMEIQKKIHHQIQQGPSLHRKQPD